MNTIKFTFTKGMAAIMAAAALSACIKDNESADAHSGAQDANALISCVSAAGTDAAKLETCAAIADNTKLPILAWIVSSNPKIPSDFNENLLSDYEKAFYDVLRKSGNIFIGRELNKYKTITFALEKGADNNSFTITLHGAKWADTIACNPLFYYDIREIEHHLYGFLIPSSVVDSGPYPIIKRVSDTTAILSADVLYDGEICIISEGTIMTKLSTELNNKNNGNHTAVLQILHTGIDYYQGLYWTFRTEGGEDRITFERTPSWLYPDSIASGEVVKIDLTKLENKEAYIGRYLEIYNSNGLRIYTQQINAELTEITIRIPVGFYVVSLDNLQTRIVILR